SDYQKCSMKNKTMSQEVKRILHKTLTITSQPVISVIIPVFNTPVQRLEEAVESVLAQAYEHWELVLVDDGSTDADLLRTLPRLAARDRRIILAKLKGHEGISVE